MTNKTKDTIYTLQEKLNALEMRGAGQFSPFAFHYCRKLCQKLEKNRSDNHAAIKKISDKINALDLDFNEAYSFAASQLKTLIINTEKHAELKQALETGRFQEISKNALRVRHAEAYTAQIATPIQSLTKRLNSLSQDRAHKDQSDNLDSFLQQADSELANSFEGDAQVHPADTPQILQSMQLFKQSQQQFSSEHLVQQAIADSPENPGPLNPHMLTIRSLTLMQELSPKYLERFVSYIDTVNWLEQNSGKVLSKAKKSDTGTI